MKLTPIPIWLAILFLPEILFIPNQATAGTFQHQEVNQEDFIAIARPYGDNKYDLLILQQVPSRRQCWREQGTSPVFVDPLLLNFDFTGSCERSTDSNGYSVRIDEKDYGLNYLLRVVERNGELVLVAAHRSDYRQPEVVIGRTEGIGQGLLKIQLDPGWRFTKRSYRGKILGHVYLTGDSSAIRPPETNEEGVATETPNSSEKPVRELTFTSGRSSRNTRVSPRPFREDNNNLPREKQQEAPTTPPINFSSPNPSSNSALPPPPSPKSSVSPSTSSEFSDLPPLPVPSQVSRSSVVPPPNSSPQQGGRISEGYRVLVSAMNSQQQAQVKGLYPDAFPTTYQGRSLWQIGRFSTRENAEMALRGFENRGISGLIIP
ncbi:MAG: DUF3747 domain-containing protein [Microcystaceae cyanobacterium]